MESKPESTKQGRRESCFARSRDTWQGRNF